MTEDRPAPSRAGGGITTGPSRRAAVRASPGVGATPEAMRAARRRWPSGVAIVTTRESDDAVRGATVSAFTFVSLEPALVLVCLQRDTSTARAIAASGVLAVSILNRAQEALADRFAGLGPQPDRLLSGIPHAVAASGSPVFLGSDAWLDCRVTALHDGGDHLIVVAEVVMVELGEAADDPLVSFEGSYRRLEGA